MRTAQVTMERRAARYDVIDLHAALLTRKTPQAIAWRTAD
jgi:hypothetical protein